MRPAPRMNPQNRPWTNRRQHPRRVVRKNARVKLRNADDRCIAASESAACHYCAKVGNQALTLLLYGGNRPLTHGSSLSIKTTEVWKGKWMAHTFLGAFGDVHQL